jgi:signal transduction histidine kinase
MISLLLTILTASFIGLLGLVVYYANPKRDTNLYFALFACFDVLWIVTNFLENEPGIIGVEHLELFLRLDFVFAIISFYLWLRFCELFSRKPIRFIGRTHSFPALVLIGAYLIYHALFTDSVLSDVHFSEYIEFSPGWLWGVYNTYLVILVLLGFVFLYIAKRNAKRAGDMQYIAQINLIFFGFFISLSNALFINILQGIVQMSVDTARIGIYGMIVLVGCTAYAIIRHHFFSIQLALVRTFSFAFLSVTIILAYVLFFEYTTKHMYNSVHYGVFVGVSAFYMTLLTLIFHPLQRKADRICKHTFYESNYDSEKLLAELTHIMASNINIQVMTMNLLHTLTSALQIRQGAFLVREQDGSFSIHTNSNQEEFFLRGDAVPRLEELCRTQGSAGNVPMTCVFHDLPDGAEKDLFREYSIGIVLPVVVDTRVIALLVLSDKKSGRAYTPEDKEFLTMFTDEVAIAIQNSQSYREIQALTEKLEARVAERTKALEEAQQSELKKAQDVANLKDEFVFLATHELRTPITAIRVFLDLIESHVDSLSDTLRGYLTSVGQASTQLNELIDDLLEIARGEGNTEALALAPVDVCEIVRDVEATLSPLISQKQVTITHTASMGSSALAMGNKDKLREVITNILSNAIKYNREGGEIVVSCVDTESTLMVEVHDTGYGIPVSQQPQIFSKFFRATTKDTEEIVGTGLGLFIARMLIEKMGGVIKFSSVEGEGTTLAFSLPKGHTLLTKHI